MRHTIDRLPKLLSVFDRALDGVRSHYRAIGLLEVPVPVLVGITGACENVSTLYTVAENRRIHLTQTGQLALEQALQFAPGVCCVTRSFRTDFLDKRHLNEFTLVEEEVSCDHPSVGIDPLNYDEDTMFEHLLEHITGAVRAMIAAILDGAAEAVDELGGDVERLERVLARPFGRISYTDAVSLLNRADRLPPLTWGDDLRSSHEQLLVELVAREGGEEPVPTFVTHFPTRIKFFNMKTREDDPEVVSSADLLLPGAGESVGSAVREHDYEKLVDRLVGSVMFRHLREQGIASLEDFVPYLSVIEDGRTRPHAGYGIGLERVIQYAIGETDIRASSPTYVLNELMGFDRELALAQTGSNSPGF